MNCTFLEAYKKIQSWYSANLALLKQSNASEDYKQKSAEIINALPPASSLNELEIRAILGEVVYGYLEWGFHQADEQFKMGAYAFGAFEAGKVSYSLNPDEMQGLRGSKIWPFLMINRNK